MRHVTSSADVRGVNLAGATIGGTEIKGSAMLFPLLQGERVQVMRFSLDKGFVHALHSHPEHESVGIVISGRVRMTIAGQEYVLVAGDVWWHPANEPHESEALDDSVCFEIHVPRRAEYVRFFE